MLWNGHYIEKPEMMDFSQIIGPHIKLTWAKTVPSSSKGINQVVHKRLGECYFSLSNEI